MIFPPIDNITEYKCKAPEQAARRIKHGNYRYFCLLKLQRQSSVRLVQPGNLTGSYAGKLHLITEIRTVLISEGKHSITGIDVNYRIRIPESV